MVDTPNKILAQSATLELASLSAEDFESLVAAIFRAQILTHTGGQASFNKPLNHTVVSVLHSGRGADQGKDLLVTTIVSDCVTARPFKWLVQCKHNATSRRAIRLSDFKDCSSLVDVVTHHGADGYLLACTPRPSTNVQRRFDNLTSDSGNPYHFVTWDETTVRVQLLKYPEVVEVFFPVYYQRHFQRKTSLRDVIGWVEQEGLPQDELIVLNDALSKVVRVDETHVGSNRRRQEKA
jgi:hypothetical protein